MRPKNQQRRGGGGEAGMSSLSSSTRYQRVAFRLLLLTMVLLSLQGWCSFIWWIVTGASNAADDSTTLVVGGREAMTSRADSWNNQTTAAIRRIAPATLIADDKDSIEEDDHDDDEAYSEEERDPRLLLNVPFYVYEDMFWAWANQTRFSVPKKVRDSNHHLLSSDYDSSLTLEEWVEIAFKHSDDYWFAQAAFRHPMRTYDPNEAKIFVIPTLLNVMAARKHDYRTDFCVSADSICDTDALLQGMDEYLSASPWFQRNRGWDHVIVASHWFSYRVVQKSFPSIVKSNMIGFERERNFNLHNRIMMPSYYVGKGCPILDESNENSENQRTDDFVLVASLKADIKDSLQRDNFKSRRDICEWMMQPPSPTNSKSNFKMSVCGEGHEQCPALSSSRFGFHVRGDTFGANRLMDTLLSHTVPIFTFQEQYNMLPDWIDWNMLSSFADVSNQTTFLSDIDTIMRDDEAYREKARQIALNRDLFDWKTLMPFDTYMYMLSVRLWPEDEVIRRQEQDVKSPFSAMILPTPNASEVPTVHFYRTALDGNRPKRVDLYGVTHQVVVEE